MARQKRNGAARALSLVLLVLSLALAFAPAPEGVGRRGEAATVAPAPPAPAPPAPPQKPPASGPESDCDASFTATDKGGNTYDFKNTTTPVAGVAFEWRVYDESWNPVSPAPVTYPANSPNPHLLNFTFPKSDKDITYLVLLMATGKPCGSDEYDNDAQDIFVPGIKADFTYEQRSCPNSPLEVQFWNKSVGQGLSYEWTISTTGGNTVYVNPNPVHPFPSAGTYTVCLKVTASNGLTDQKCEKITVDTTCKPSFEYVYDACTSQGKVPQQVNVVFTNTSKGGFCPWTFDWRFDAQDPYVTDNAQTVNHTYNLGTQHAVTMVMRDSQSCETSVTQDINVQACAADFTYVVCPTGRVVFETGAPDPVWSFPGGKPSSGAGGHVEVDYLLPGKYRVRMVSVDKNRCRCVIEKEVVIQSIVKCARNDTERGNFGFTRNGRSYQLRYKITVLNNTNLVIHRITAKAVLFMWIGGTGLGGWVPVPAREIRAEWKGHAYSSNDHCACAKDENVDADSGVRKNQAKARVLKNIKGEFCVRDQEINATFTVKVDKTHTPVVRTLLVGLPKHVCKK